MNKFRNIIIALSVAVSVIGCSKDALFEDGGSIPNDQTIAEGFVALPIDVSSLNFNDQAVSFTRSSEVELVTTTRELGLKNMKAYVFDNRTSILDNTLIEIQDVIRDYDAVGTPTYYSVLIERDHPVRIIGVANSSHEKWVELVGDDVTEGRVVINDEGAIQLKGDGTDFTYEDFLYYAQMTYDPSADNPVLKNSDDGLLPIYTESVTFDKLNSEVLEQWEQTDHLKARFAYARIDVVLNDGKNDSANPNFTNLLGVSAMEAPVTIADPISGEPSSLPRVHTHEVTPLSNLSPVTASLTTYGKLPSSITSENIGTKYIQGLYIYPTAPLENSPADLNGSVEDNKPVYIIIRLNNGVGNERFYKLILRYTKQNYDEGETPDEGETFFIYNSSRYLVNITKLNSPGYTSYDEAAQGPPSNIEYSITVDDKASNIVSNGQYYLGVNKDHFELEMSTYNSNLIDRERNYTVGSSNDISWKVDNDAQVVKVNFSLSYNGGTANGLVGAHPDDFEVLSKVEPTSLKSSITTASGVTCTFLDGVTIEVNEKRDAEGNILYDASGNIIYEQTSKNIVGAGNPNISSGDIVADWKDYFGVHNFEVSIPFNVSDNKITIKVGELTRDVHFKLNESIITDYSNQAFVNRLLTGDETQLPKTSQANSYIIVPYAGVINEYYIPIVTRINEFWSDYAKTPVDNMILAEDWRDNDQLSIALSWYDGESIVPYSITKSVSPSGVNAIKISFDGDEVVGNYQNFAVNVMKDTQVIWTWHFWVTDYNPYINDSYARPNVTNEDFATIPVQNGSLHRYGEAKWQNDLSGRAIMDRNLGARSTSFAGGENGAGAGALYYQYGRKDPFPGVAARQANGELFVKNNLYNSIATVAALEDAVVQPTKFVVGATEVGENWCTQIDVLQYLWHDYKASTKNLRKSIFDPSPLGWMIAPSVAFTHLDYNGWEPRIGDFEWIESVNPGLIHSYSAAGTTFETYFPASGMISAASAGKLENKTEGISEWNTYLWTSDPSAATTGGNVNQAKNFQAGKKIVIYPWGPTPAVTLEKPALAPASRGNALPVRAIQEGVY